MAGIENKLDESNMAAEELFESHYIELAYNNPVLLLPESTFKVNDFELSHREAVKYMMFAGLSDGGIVGTFIDKYGFEAGVDLARVYVSE
ncbi:hypothetical protein HN865_00495 [Candidatus Woesearchaeota archaeon]|jgi:hypothetical protein|nr:hypothetical protein [Candidatus Woesearchaeota archaeon]